MKLTLLIETGETCSFKLLDTTCGDLGYLPESSQDFIKDRFKFKDTIGIVQLVLNKTKGSEVIQEPTFIDHRVTSDWITLNSNFDGWFTLTYIVIPNEEWFNSHQDYLQLYQTVYYSDGVDIYKYFNGESQKVDLQELVERNEEDTTISKYTQDFTSICFLKKCFINLCKQIFEQRGFSKCVTRGNVDQQLIYNRDLIWMTLNTISYLTEFEQLAEAERVIELFEETCNGICKSYNREYDRIGCGCS